MSATWLSSRISSSSSGILPIFLTGQCSSDCNRNFGPDNQRQFGLNECISIPREPSSAGLRDVGTCRHCSGAETSWISVTLLAIKGLNRLFSLVMYWRTVRESDQKVTLWTGRSNSLWISTWRRVEGCSRVPLVAFLYLSSLPKLDFGLWARVFSAVFAHPEPTIDFSDCSAVSHSKTRHFRFGSCDFPVTSLPVPIMWFPVTSGSGDVTSGSECIQTRPHPNEATTSKRGSIPHMGLHYYFRQFVFQYFFLLIYFCNLVFETIFVQSYHFGGFIFVRVNQTVFSFSFFFLV